MDISKEGIIAQRSKLSPERRLLLEKRLRGEIETNSRLKIIPRRYSANPVPLSFAQKRLWLLSQLEPNSSYNELKVLHLQGSLNVAALQQSFNEIVRRHEALRTTFAFVEEQAVQVIAPTLNLTIPVIALQEFPPGERDAKVQQLANEFALQHIDLAKGPLLRVNLLQLGEAEFVLLLLMHHIVYDQWTKEILIQELAVLYKAFSKAQPSPLPELPIQYPDFAVWQHQWLQGEKLETQVSYWKQQLKGAPPALDLPTDHPRPAVWRNQGAIQSLVMPQSLTKALNALSQQEEATLFMTLLAALNILLYRYTSQEDILIGTTISGRNRVELEKLIGFFINTQVMRTDLSGNPPFKTLLQRVQEVTLRAYEHQDLPFEKLLDELNIERDLSRNPLFQVAFVLEYNNTRQSLELPGLTLRPLEIYSGTAKFDLTLFIADTEQGLIATLEYSTKLFNAATIIRMLRHFQTLLEGIVADPDQRLSDLPLLTEAERQTLLVEWNNTQTDYPQNECIHQLFEAQVKRTPNAIAVIFEEQQLTYQELNQRANQLAHHLRWLGVEPEVLVGICTERSLDMVVGLLGILKAGGAYVPLDPTYLSTRLAFMLSDSQVSVLLTQEKLLEKLPVHQASVVVLDRDWEAIAQHSQSNCVTCVTANNLAYVIYTSGSTGNPKGVAIEHHSPVTLVQWAISVFSPQQCAGVLASTSICFDLSVFELFVPLSCGGLTILAQNALHLPSLPLCEQVTLINTVPSAIAELERIKGIPASVQTVILAGEALQNQLVQKIYEINTIQQVFNLYGPSEDTTYSTFALVEKGATQPPSIGRPIANTLVYILDALLQPVPVGVAGELHISGDGLARGYLRRPELTAEKFIPNPFALDKPDSRLYKTGDLACYLSDGNIEFLGRIDNQVKIRGFRIELQEVETVLTQHPAVRASLVTVREDEPGSKRLVAYVVLNQEQVSTIIELRHFLEEKLPNYMVPSAFMMLEALPLTPNGKVDLRSLPAPEALRPELEVAYVMPQTELEKTIATVWQKALNIENIGIHDNFFELGGHSLLMVKVHNQLREIFKADVSILEMFRYPTISSLAEYLSALKNQTTSSSYKTDIQTENIEAGKAQQKKRLQKLKSIVNKKEVNES